MNYYPSIDRCGMYSICAYRVGTDHKDDNNPLSQAVLGITAVEDVSDYVAYTEHNHLANIVVALESLILKMLWNLLI